MSCSHGHGQRGAQPRGRLPHISFHPSQIPPKAEGAHLAIGALGFPSLEEDAIERNDDARTISAPTTMNENGTRGRIGDDRQNALHLFIARASPSAQGDVHIPHAERFHQRALGGGAFARYGHPALGVRFENDLALVDEIVSEVFEQRMKIFEIPEGTPLDHGALVPLYFLWEAGWRGRVVVLGSSYLPDRDHVSYGRCVERAARALGRRVVFIGSANLSHRLSALAPSGYHPRAYEFDREIVSSLEDGDFARLSRIAPELRVLALECGHRPILIAVGAAGEVPVRHRVLSYTSLFGVGYVVAILADHSPEDQVP